MSSYSVYAMAESGSVKWRPGEELAASGFVAITFYLFVDINLCIYHIFKKKQGLYFWCMLLGVWGCAIDSTGVILRFFLPHPEPLWPLYTLFLLGGWSIYAPAQLLVLYSRLHLINRNYKLQRRVLIMIIAVSTLMIVPDWPIVWQAFNPYNPHASALYSPREAIFDRCTQLGFTFAESVISGIYIGSLIKLLNLKSSVKQRRVMMDLIYVNVIAVCLDILTVVLVFLNQSGISHPIQTFSYIIKLKLEIMTLNQLMSVASRGLRKHSFADRRYHYPSRTVEKGSPTENSKTPRMELELLQESSKSDSTKQLVVPAPALYRVQEPPKHWDSQTAHDHAGGERWPLQTRFKKRRAKRADSNAEESDDEEMGFHMWERRAKSAVEAPWFESEGQV